MSKKLRVGLIGALMIEIYGDHLIEQILSHYIHQLIKADVDLYDVQAGHYPFHDGRKVYSIDSLDSRHKRSPYDALIVIGGSILHFETLTLKIEGRKQDYPLWRLWAETSELAAKYKIMLLWNSPESPINFEGWQIPVARKLTQVVDYAVVRDPASFSNFQKIGATNVVSGIDSAWAVAQVFPQATLADSLPTKLDGDARLVVFHTDTRLPDKHFKAVVKEFARLKKNGYTVVLLPLATINSDQEILDRIHKAVPNSTVLLNNELTIKQIVAVLAKCELYIGYSFHGAITASSYGAEVIAFDHDQRRKTAELYRVMGKSSNYTTTPNALKKALDRYISSSPAKTTKTTSKLKVLQKSADLQLRNLVQVISKNYPKTKSDLSEELSIATFETSRNLDNTRQLRELSEGYKQCYDMYQDLRRRYNDLIKKN